MENFNQSFSSWRAALLAALLVSVGLTSVAGPVVPTPGSLSGYQFFPKAVSAGGGGGSGDGENVSTLQRCVYAPSAGDVTVSVANDMFDYDKDIVLYYKIVGGNGGTGYNGGGGGSSAIVLNGVLAALGPGGNGGSAAQEVAGFMKIKKGDSLRFVTGGGGGDGYATGPVIGGGGGAGYTGGGGGGSRASGALSAADAPSAAGKGGGEAPGVGGTVSGGFAGTAGIGMVGGVSTYPDGSSAPIGTGYTNTWMYYDSMPTGMVQENLRIAASPARPGMPNGKMTPGYAYFAGGGGTLGHGGQPTVILRPNYCSGSRSGTSVSMTGIVVDDNGQCNTFYNWYSYHRSRVEIYEQPTTDLKLTRAYPAVTNNGYLPINGVAGALGGQVITMYQAPVCGILR